MKNVSLSLVVALVALTGIPSSSMGQSAGGSEWKRVDVDGRFTILLPVHLKKTDAVGIEDFVREYTNGSTRLLIQHHPWGVLARPKGRRRGGGMKGYQEKDMRVDGRKAYAQRYYRDQAEDGRTYVADLTVITPDWSKGIELRVTITSSNASELRMAERIFASIDFPSEHQRPNASAHEIPADTRITLERTGCEGACPIYTLSITANGVVVYRGKQFVRIPRTIVSRIDLDQLRKLISEFDQVNYFSMRDHYQYVEDGCTSTWLDLPAAITSITINGRSKTIRHDYGCRDESGNGNGGEVYPKALFQLEQKIDEIAGTARWTR